MTREKAKIWATIPRDKLAVIAPHLEKNFETLCAFAGGATIEVKECGGEKWFENEGPYFLEHEEYRVKPAEEQTNEQKETESVVKQDLTTEPTEKLVEALDGKPLTDKEEYFIRRLRASAESTYFIALTENEFDFLHALRRMMKENLGAKN